MSIKISDDLAYDICGKLKEKLQGAKLYFSDNTVMEVSLATKVCNFNYNDGYVYLQIDMSFTLSDAKTLNKIEYHDYNLLQLVRDELNLQLPGDTVSLTHIIKIPFQFAVY